MKVGIIIKDTKTRTLLENAIKVLRPNWQITILSCCMKELEKWFCENIHPDIIFLDVSLDEGSSFLFIEKINPQSFFVIVTESRDYAIKAFSTNCIDYVLLPFDKKRIENTLMKCEHWVKAKLYKKTCDNIYNKTESILHKKFRSRFLIEDNGKYHILNIDNVSYFYEKGNITIAVDKVNCKHILNESLDILERELDASVFFRLNRQLIVSANAIQSIKEISKYLTEIKIYPDFDCIIEVERNKILSFVKWLNK